MIPSNQRPVLARASAFESFEPRRLFSSSLWEIHGDAQPKHTSDVIRVDLSPTDSSLLQATVNGTVVSTRPLANLKTLRILAGLGNDDVIVNLGPQLTNVRVLILTGPGDDSVSVTGAPATLLGGPGDDTLAGGSGDDLLEGSTGADLLQGNGGNDTLLAGDGADVLAGGAGSDRLDAGAGNDRLHGGDNDDYLLGRAGADTLFGGTGSDHYAPGAGRDKIYRGTTAEKILARDNDVLLTDPSATPAFRHFEGESDFDQWLIDAAVRRWQDLFDQPVQYWFYGWDVPMNFKTGSSPSGVIPLANDVAGSTLPTAANPSPGASGSTDHSGTNTQVAGVDEADIVETDGRYIYTAVGSQLVIVSANPADHMAVLSRTDVGGYISGLYLSPDGKLTVLASTYDQSEDKRMLGERTSLIPVDVWWNASKTLIATYNVSDPAAPTVSESTTVDGYLADSRSIDGCIYAVVSNDLWLPPPEVVGADDARHYESQADYVQHLQSIVSDRQLPQFTTSADGQTRTGPIVSLPDTYVSGDNASSESLTSLLLIDPSTGAIGPDASATIVGPSGTIYASSNSLYLTGWDWDEDAGVQQTNLAKFTLAPDSISLAAVGSVDGSIIDQYSMGENSLGDLNIATSSGWGNDSSNNVYTLHQFDTSLDPIGALLNIAPGERIFSSRFIGDKGYLVTYHQTDPLFSLDLSDPTDPKIAGQLDLTGFSSFLQPIEGHYLLGLGHSGDTQGHVGGLQLSLFDVLDPAHPKLVDTYQFDSSDPATGSSAEYDPHAIQYFPDQHTLALPIWRYDDTTYDFTEGTAVLKIDTATGFHPLAFIPQPGASRSLRIDQTLYTLGYSNIIASDLNDPSHVFSTVNISDDSGTDDGGGVIPLIM